METDFRFLRAIGTILDVHLLAQSAALTRIVYRQKEQSWKNQQR
ncbi:hypothetical protein [Bradyrhizobium japonicum]|nr:hypothetical protein [Bradyrhizobium japonicum]WLB24535.1 hypothetical protein QIH95_50685 [Bradyrhizobium japonicum]WLB24537.1 hypothetical protein QIH95_50695 [Bradyrhizobium japonicum]